MTQPHPDAPGPHDRPPDLGVPAAYNAYPPPVSYGRPPAPELWNQAPYQQPQPSGLYVAAAVINWVMLGLIIVGTLGFGIIAAAWFIPMTIFIHKGAKDRYNHTALAVCTLLFCNLIAGILMLADSGNRRPRPYA